MKLIIRVMLFGQSVEEESSGQGVLSSCAKRKEQVKRMLQKGRAKRQRGGFQLKGSGGCSHQLLHLVSFVIHSLKWWRRYLLKVLLEI